MSSIGRSFMFETKLKFQLEMAAQKCFKGETEQVMNKWRVRAALDLLAWELSRYGNPSQGISSPGTLAKCQNWETVVGVSGVCLPAHPLSDSGQSFMASPE